MWILLCVGTSQAYAVTFSYNDGGTHVLGPGLISPIFVSNNTAVSILDGTQILPPPTNGSGSSFAHAPDGIEVRTGSHLVVMGGEFTAAMPIT